MSELSVSAFGVVHKAAYDHADEQADMKAPRRPSPTGKPRGLIRDAAKDAHLKDLKAGMVKAVLRAK